MVLLEDFGAVIGVFVAASCMGLSSLTNSAVPDAFGSILVGGILGSVASFIIYTNVAALVGRYLNTMPFINHQSLVILDQFHKKT